MCVGVGGFGGVADTVQPAFAPSSASSNPFVFGGNVQSSMASSQPWNNVQVAHTQQLNQCCLHITVSVILVTAFV